MRRWLILLGGLVACADAASGPAGPAGPAVTTGTTTRESLANALTRAAGRPVRVVHEADGPMGYADDTPLEGTDRAGGERRARAIVEATRDVLGIDPKQLGSITWGEHPKPIACATQLWPGTTEETTHGICVAFDHEHRPLWISIMWAPSIAAHHEAIKPSRDVVAALKGGADAGTTWEDHARLELDADQPVYYVGSSDAEGLSTTRVDAITGKVLGVRRIGYGDLEDVLDGGAPPFVHP